MPTKTIKKKFNVSLPLTDGEKLRVLKEVRSLLDERFTNNDWKRMIDGVEHYCLFGGVQKVCGIAGPNRYWDNAVSSCSLTSTLFDAIPEHNKFKTVAQASMARDRRVMDRTATWHRMEDRMLMVRALQNVNDLEGQAAVLEVLDRAIENLTPAEG